MKLEPSPPDSWQWTLSRDEFDLLERIAHLFPLIPPEHHQLSRNLDENKFKADQAWLEESMTAHAKELSQQLEQWLGKKGQPSPMPEGMTDLTLVLSRSEVEKLLQILNHLRIGSWIHLGSPDQETLQNLDPTPARRRLLFVMEFCGLVQNLILHTLAGPDDS